MFAQKHGFIYTFVYSAGVTVATDAKYYTNSCMTATTVGFETYEIRWLSRWQDTSLSDHVSFC